MTLWVVTPWASNNELGASSLDLRTYKMSNENETESAWDQYYKITAGRPPREFLNRTLRRFQAVGLAVDLGCGAGSESIFLLQHGWQVLAIDQQESAIQKLSASVPPNTMGHLETQVTLFKTINLPPADLIWAGRSLPFCEPEEFNALWHKICGALLPNGRFAGDFFGTRHAWASEIDMTFHTKEQVLALCTELQLEYIIEEEGEEMTAMNGIQHWHMFTISALKV
jgi:tellurite methyltransferase